MAFMAKMRNMAPALIIGIIVFFVVYMALSALWSNTSLQELLGVGGNTVGSVEGKDITLQEFQKYLDQALENEKQRSQKEIDEEAMPQFRDQVWDGIVNQFLTEGAYKEFGITVTDDEIRAVILGEEPPAFLKQNFIDSTGNFNRAAYEQAVMDPKNKEIVIQVEDLVRQQLYAQKLQAALFAAVQVSDAEIKRRYIDQNTTMSMEFLFYDVMGIPDSTIPVTDDQVREYYNTHADKFKVEEQRKVKSVFFRIVPSVSDTNAVLKNLQIVRRNALNDTSAFKTFVDTYSESPFKIDTMSAAQLPSALLDSIVAKKDAGAIVGPVPTPDGFGLYKIDEIIPGGEEVVRASHILVMATGDDKKDSTEAYRIYNEITKGSSYTDMAAKFSGDKGSAVKGGDLGWFGKGRMVPEFEKPCFTGAIGEVQKPFKTQFGYHIVKVTGKNDSKYVVEKITNAVKTSGVTREEIYASATDFSFIADKNGFDAEAINLSYKMQESTPFLSDVTSVPGLGYNPYLVKFAFENDTNTVSPVFKVPNGYTVARVSGIIKQGVRTFEEAKAEAKALLLRELKFKKAKEEITALKPQIKDSLSSVMNINPLVRFNRAENFLPNGSIPAIGVDYRVSFTASRIPLNTISDPIKGQRGYYIIKVNKRNEFDQTAFQMQKPTLRTTMVTERKQNFYTQWLENSKKNADISDKRDKFFGK